ncbi:MAG: Mrp/NBP35 family ATP-binding protein [Lachnospiraceae bacterium]|nr:Mrp/NBP35 family ATP-binding protein [Lachnospiraceae bacterium]
MSEQNCDHNCANCGSYCGERDTAFLKETGNKLSHVKKVIGVVSGKGGVGKSMVTSLCAVNTMRMGYDTAILDADITGPSIPKMFGINTKADATEDGLLPSVSESGVKLMSVNLILDNENDPVAWRGPILSGVVKQFWTDVVWGDVDFMFVDMPPGTSDVYLTVGQSLPIDGLIIVTSPQELVSMIVEKSVVMAEKMDIPVLGLVENFSFMKCPHCGERINLFGESHAKEVAEKYGMEYLAGLPVDPALAAAADSGEIESVNIDGLDKVLTTLRELLQ